VGTSQGLSNPRSSLFWESICVARSIMAMQRGGGGVMLQHYKYFFGNYGIKDAKGHLWVWNRKLVMVGHHDMMAPYHILHNNHKPCPQCLVLEMFHHPNPRYR
jgi:hypothetical protein